MKVYKLTGVRIDSGEDWEFSGLFWTREEAEKHKLSEIKAYTTDRNNQIVYDCPYKFTITEIKVE